MPFPTARFLAIILACLPVHQGRALILYGSGTTDVSNTLNITPPESGAPWKYVARFGTNNASGIYLGNGFVLTANHVNLVNNNILIDGTSYDRDQSFVPLKVSEAPASVDLKLVKILGNPGLPPLPLNYAASDLNANFTFIGWGVGKGAIVADKGWTWNATRTQRWGTNQTIAAETIAYSGYSYEALITEFNRALGADTAQLTLGDSGSGLFQEMDGVWKLAGVATTVTTNANAFFDMDLAASGDQPDASFFVRLKDYAPLLRYENWAHAKLGDHAASLTDDLDYDGIPNLLEYAFHSDPNTPGNASPQVGLAGNLLTLTYTKLMSATDLTYSVEESADLASWNPAVVTNEIVSNTGVAWVIKAKVAMGDTGQKFLRLNVTKSP